MLQQSPLRIACIGAVVLPLVLGACATSDVPLRGTPYLDAHQHLVSPAFAPVAKLPERDAAALVREMDEAGIERAIVLSVAYSFADERKQLPEPAQLSREENDWTSAQVMAFPRRLIGFCSANPLREDAITELDRCLDLPAMVGIKLHFGNSGVSLRDAGQRESIGKVFDLAQRRSAPTLVHMRARGGSNFGPEDVELLLALHDARAPATELIVAHLGLAGPGYPPENDAIMAKFAQRAAVGDARLRNVWFDVATNVHFETSAEDAAQVARRLREVGIDRILYGSDLSPPAGSIAGSWRDFTTKVPLTLVEFATIAGNRPTFVR